MLALDSHSSSTKIFQWLKQIMELEFSDDSGLELEYAEVYTEYFEILKKISQKNLKAYEDSINTVQMQLGEQFE